MKSRLKLHKNKQGIQNPQRGHYISSKNLG